LAWSIGVEWPQYCNREVKTAVVSFGDLIGCDLGSGIRRLALQRVLLIYGDVFGGAIALAGAGLDNAPHLCTPASFQNIQGTLDVDRNIARWRHIAVRNADQRGEVKNDFHPVNGMLREKRVTNVTGNYLYSITIRLG
jgi:hypothetical protein